MAVGSAFDAYIKSYLFLSLFGPSAEGADHYSFDALFTSMVDPQNRDWALPNGKYVFEQYKAAGVLQDLLSALEVSRSPRFEFSVYGVASGYREGIQDTIINIPLSGKPDLSFIITDKDQNDINVILDFKVNGFLSKHNISPTKGYTALKSLNTDFGSHKSSLFSRVGPLTINLSIPLNDSNPQWATQMSIYAWLTGSSPGSRSFIAGVDQIVCSDSNGGQRLPSIKVATHRSFIDEKFQVSLFNSLHSLWELLSQKPLHFFRDLSLEDSLARQEMLDQQASTEKDQWFQTLR